MNKLEKLIKNEDVKALTEKLFDIELTEGQEEIVRNIAYQKNDRIIISSFTRYGKTTCLAMGSLLYIIFNRNKKKRVLLLAPDYNRASLIRDVMAENILKTPLLRNEVEMGKGKEHLKKEVSKKRITFEGGCELRVLSASGEAKRLMGFGGDLIILDESCLVDFETYRTKISRMLGDNPNSMLVEASNPWHRKNHFWRHWNSERFKKIHIDYKQGLKEGRVAEEFIEGRKKELPETEFEILYEANFPEKSEYSLIPYGWIKQAVENDMKIKEGEVTYGLDVAGAGNDLNVLTKVKSTDDKYELIWQKSWTEPSTMNTVGRVKKEVEEGANINVDAIGIGKGVADRLKEGNYKVNLVKVGEKPTGGKDEFQNKKAQFYWKVRNLFEESRISIKENSDLINQLTSIEVNYTSSRKKKIQDPDKSPDFADSLMLALAKRKTPEMHITTVKTFR